MRARLQDSIDATAEKIAAADPGADAPPKDLKPGDTVLLLDLNAKATVLTAAGRHAANARCRPAR